MSDWEQFSEWVFQRGDGVKSDTLFVFGTPHHIDDFARRIKQLWEMLSLSRIIISGYNGEAERIMVSACMLGIPPDAFWTERKASNTRENALFSLDLLCQACTEHQVHLLAKLHAAPRSLLTMRTVLPEWKFSLHWVDYYRVGMNNWWNCDSFRFKVIDEVNKILLYGKAGDIDVAHYMNLLQKVKALAIAESYTSKKFAASQIISRIETHHLKKVVNAPCMSNLSYNLKEAEKPDLCHVPLEEEAASVAAIAYDGYTDEVVFVKQHPTVPNKHWKRSSLLKLITGVASVGEEEAKCRELIDMTGMLQRSVFRVGDYLQDPILSTDRTALFCVLVDLSSSRVNANWAITQNVLQRIPSHDVDQMVDTGRIGDCLTFAAAQWVLRAKLALRRLATEYQE